MFFKFPKIEAVGLDISDYSIEIVSLGGSAEKPKLLALGRIILEPGIIKNGRIIEKTKLENSLKKLFENLEFGKIKTKKIIFSLPELKSFIHVFELDKNLEKREKLERIKIQAEQIFPYSLKELYFDCWSEEEEARQGKEDVLIVAFPGDVVDSYLEVFENCRLQPIAMETELISLARVFAPKDKELVLIVDIGAKTTNFGIFGQKGLRFSVSMPVAGDKFTESIGEKLKTPQQEAENLKREIGLNPELKKGKLFFILQEEIQKIIREIRSIEDYFQKRDNKEIKKIILVGGSSSLPLLPQYLTENLGKPVLIGDPWIKINIDILKKKEYFKRALKIDPVLYAACLGAALRGLAKNSERAGINLLKKSK